LGLIKAIGQSENELAEIYIKMKDYEKLETVLTVVSLTHCRCGSVWPGLR
jgi:hypothetical protein